jgi:hypothetical protein
MSDAPVSALEIAFDWNAAAGTGVELKDLAVRAGEAGVLGHFVEVRAGQAIFLLALDPRIRSLEAGQVHLGTLVISCPADPGASSSAIAFRDGILNTAPPGPFPVVNRVTVLSENRVLELSRGNGLELANGSFACQRVSQAPALDLWASACLVSFLALCGFAAMRRELARLQGTSVNRVGKEDYR